MGLELVLQDAPRTGATIDVYAIGLAQMYTGIGGSPNGPPAWMMDPMQQPQNNWMPEYNQPLQGFNTSGGFQTTLPQYIQPEPIQPFEPQYGLLDSHPAHTSYDLPGVGAQLHLHGPDQDTITHGHIKSYDQDILANLNGYDASMASYNADLLGLKKNIFDP